jgi:hypothetical protein
MPLRYRADVRASDGRGNPLQALVAGKAEGASQIHLRTLSAFDEHDFSDSGRWYPDHRGI